MNHECQFSIAAVSFLQGSCTLVYLTLKSLSLKVFHPFVRHLWWWIMVDRRSADRTSQ
jgi:hypothetical protein